jgi:SAM-dependent methyltransferase
MEKRNSPTPKGIAYSSPEIERYFRSNRVRWDDLYESERTVLARLNPPKETRVLDIGCGCGGLGLALLEKFGISDYTGIEINELAAKAAKEMNARAHIFNADFLGFSSPEVGLGSYDLVVSLSCIDWNVGFEVALPKAFSFVRPGGRFLASFRLTDKATIDDISRSYQFINYAGGGGEGERASYVVLNARELIQRLEGLKPESASGYGYWGKPGSTAVTPFDKLCFAVFSVRKPLAVGVAGAVSWDLELPSGLLQQ